ncbi:hypothetical protein [Bremerella cremea]|uniref:hypothetical protein n=1 Tax=Bremerella cremea TaxID=1031537 RepID=UPI0031F197D0
MATYYVTTSGSNGNAGTSEGAAWANPGYAASQMSTGDVCYVKSGTYTLTTSTAGSGGPVSLPQGVIMEGYQITPGDLGTPPVIFAGAITSVNLVSAAGSLSVSRCRNLKVDGNSNSGVHGFAASFRDLVERCVATRCVFGFNQVNALESLADSCSSRGFQNCNATLCHARNCPVGFALFGSRLQVVSCIAEGGSGNGFLTGSSLTTEYAPLLAFCHAYGYGSNGFFLQVANAQTIACCAVGNGAYGFNVAQTSIVMRGCAGYGNTSGNTNAGAPISVTSLTADPYDNAAAGDFNLNNVAGGGAVLRGLTAEV